MAGIVFSLLMFAIFGLLRRSIPTEPLEPGAWLAADTKTIALALNLVPFAGVAFLWFIGGYVINLVSGKIPSLPRCFFGSALLFLVMLFAAAAVMGAVLLFPSTAEPNELISSTIFHYARAAAYIVNNVYATKMAAVFMI